MLLTKYNPGGEINKEMGGPCSKFRRDRRATNSVWVKKERNHVEDLWCVILQQNVAQDRDWWRAVVHAGMNLRVQ
jgi:hypothetical protein